MIEFGNTDSFFVDIQNGSYIDINQDFYLPNNAIISDVLIGEDNEIQAHIDNYGNSSVYYRSITKGFNISLGWEMGENTSPSVFEYISVNIRHTGSIFTGVTNTLHDDAVILKMFTINDENFVISTILTEQLKIKQKLNLLGL